MHNSLQINKTLFQTAEDGLGGQIPDGSATDCILTLIWFDPL